MSLVGRIANRVLALNNGEILAIGTVEQIRSNPEVQSAYLGGTL